MHNIVLIGFMGTGKTTIGKALADQLGKSFVDIDEQIEETCGMTISEIFAVHGESFFRETERRAIKHVACCSNVVVATGGGAVLFPENVAHLKEVGIIISLHASPEAILNRIENDSVKRPLLQNPDKLQTIINLLETREDRYRAADFCVDTSHDTPASITNIIIDYLQSHRYLN